MSRRKLNFHRLSQAVHECRSLLNSGYSKTGNWTLGQACQHLRLTIEANLHGYPAWMSALGFPLRPLLRTFLLPRLFRGDSPAGIRTAPRFVPPQNLDDKDEVEAFVLCVAEFENHPGPFFPHPGFGQLGPDSFERFHAAHAAHHLSFLVPVESTPVQP